MSIGTFTKKSLPDHVLADIRSKVATIAVGFQKFDAAALQSSTNLSGQGGGEFIFQDFDDEIMLVFLSLIYHMIRNGPIGTGQQSKAIIIGGGGEGKNYEVNGGINGFCQTNRIPTTSRLTGGYVKAVCEAVVDTLGWSFPDGPSGSYAISHNSYWPRNAILGRVSSRGSVTEEEFKENSRVEKYRRVLSAWSTVDRSGELNFIGVMNVRLNSSVRSEYDIGLAALQGFIDEEAAKGSPSTDELKFLTFCRDLMAVVPKRPG